MHRPLDCCIHFQFPVDTKDCGSLHFLQVYLQIITFVILHSGLLWNSFACKQSHPVFSRCPQSLMFLLLPNDSNWEFNYSFDLFLSHHPKGMYSTILYYLFGIEVGYLTVFRIVSEKGSNKFESLKD